MNNLAAIAIFLLFASSGLAAEPYETFLGKLRDEKFFDLALVYLEDIAQRRNLDPEFSQAIELEKALLQVQAADFIPSKSPLRAEKLNLAEQLLKRFVESQPNHPRCGEAKIKLGGLLQLRAQEALTSAGVWFSTDAATLAQQHAEVPDAIRYFDEAHKLFEGTIAELSKIEESLKGDRVDPNDEKQVLYRERVRQDLREAQLHSAKAVAERGLSRATTSGEQKADLELARQMFSDLYTKEQVLLGIRFYALFYRGQILYRLGQPEDAIDGYLRIIDQQGIDALRPLQTDTVTELIRVLASEGKFEAAVDKAETWIQGLRGDEQSMAEVSDLKLEYAKLRVAWIESLKAADPSDNSIAKLQRATRDDLRSLLRQGGPNSEQVSQLLGQLGFEKPDSNASTDLPKVQDLNLAIQEAQSRIDNTEAIAVNIGVFNGQLARDDLAETEKGTIQTQLDELQAEVKQNLEQALVIVREGLRVAKSSDDRAQLFQARFQLAFVLLKLGQNREAIVVSEFISRTAPGTPQGLNAARVVLGAYSQLMRENNADSVGLMTEVAPFAEYLIASWPQSAEAASASNALVQLAVQSKDWDLAEKYLQRLPESDPNSAKLYWQFGGALYDQFVNSQADSAVTQEQRNSLRVRADRWLQLAAKNIVSDDLQAALNVASSLAALKLAEGDISQASSILLSGDGAPLRRLESDRAAVSQDTALAAYRTALQIVSAQVADGEINAQVASAEIQRYVTELQKVASANEEGQKKLPAIFASIARDLKDKLGTLDQPKKRSEFSNVVTLVMKEAAKSEMFGTQYWAASSLLSIAEEIATQDKAAADPIFESAASLLKQMSQTAKQRPDWVQPESADLQLKLLLAQACEGAGDFRTALQTYGDILDQNENLLDIQMRVAKALQEWATGQPARFEAAIKGARPNAKTGNNIFWGWGKIGQVTSRKMEDFSPQFFEARYQLAWCQLQLAGSKADQAAKTSELSRAERTLTETLALYPNLGSADDRHRYDGLMKTIRKELGK